MTRALLGSRTLQVAAAGSAIAVGILVYALDRNPARSLGMPPGLPFLSLQFFGTAGAWLPSFVHAFAFSMFTACVLPVRHSTAYCACAAWAAIDTLFEIGQHEYVRGQLARGIQEVLGGSALSRALSLYFLQGSFDPHDINAALAGGATAALVLVGINWAAKE
jgi:thiol:disulfide interchange protein